ncbi:MAG: 3-hydroxybutyrate dehydrogenase [Rhodospirillales bacterium]|nr:3-hydroxybutyrate dehydrogenase [Rhodospirillales bacterium]
MTQHLKGKTAVITGSTSGIGLGIAKNLAKHGLNIVINGFGDKSDIEKELKTLQSNGIKAIYNGADMTKPEEIKDLIETAQNTFGSVDVLVNNAGIQFVAPVEEFPPAKWEAIMSINLSSAFYTTHHTIPLMKKQGWGRIINMASAHGLVASPFKSAYVAAKHGIVGFTKSVALEVAENNIRVNAICPGYVKTPLVDGQIADTAKARGISEEEVVKDVLLKAQHTKQFVTIEQVADIALFLCSSATDNMTGSCITVDGGWTAA